MQKKQINMLVEELLDCFAREKKVLICGCGGSSSQADHFATELIVKYKEHRDALPAISLNCSPIITAIVNDLGAEQMFSRQIEGLGWAGDLLIVLTTSGNSQSIIQACKTANHIGMKIFGLLGKDGGKTRMLCNKKILVQGDDTARIQEEHLRIIHKVCEQIEKRIRVV